MIDLMNVTNLDNRYNTLDVLGFIPTFLNEHDERSAAEQFDANYVSGWSPFQGFTYNPTDHSLKYPGDPKMKPLVRIDFRDEVIFVYPYSWVGITKEGSDDIEVCRMD